MSNAYANVAVAGTDVHYKFSTVTFRDSVGGVVGRERLDHTNRQTLREQLSRWPKGIMVVMESSFGWPWLSDLMLEVGLRPQLSNSFKVEKMRKARGWAKSNRKDADLLSLLPFEATNWWQVWRAPKDVRDRRELMRYRSAVVAGQTRTKNRIHAIFHRHGIFYDYSDLFGGDRALASYCLVAPMSVDTGEREEDPDAKPHGRHIGHRGNSTLKWAFIDAAHGAVRHGGKWRAMFDRYTDNGSHNRNRGYIKVARELVKVVRVIWKKNVPYQEQPPARPGSGSKGNRSRTG